MQADPWKAETIPAMVLAGAAAFGDRTALEEGDTRLSYAALAETALRSARGFMAAGVERGDRVGIWAPNVSEWILAALGIHFAGGVLVPLNTRYKAAEVGYVLRKSRARLLVTVGDFLGSNYADSLEGEDLPDLEGTVLLRGEARSGQSWQAFRDGGERYSDADARERAGSVRPDDLSDILFTSGTTGDPKGVMTAHAQNLRAFEAWSEVTGLCADDRYLAVNPFSHAFGYKAGWLSAFMRGATLLPHAVFDAPAIFERIAPDRISVLPGPPAVFQTFLANPELASHDLSSLRLAVTGGAPVPVEMVLRMRSDLGFDDVVTGYGLTECCGIVSMCRHDDDPETIAQTCGRAIPGIEVRCVDEKGVEAPRGEPGEVVVRGYNVMRGYFEDEAETAATIDRHGWLHTGDIAVMDERGNLRITDRIKDMFIMGGFNCYPAEIEKLMFAHEGIAAAAVIGVADERMGEVGAAFVVPMAGATLTPQSVIEWCRGHMANFKVPRYVEIVDALPMNAGGKVVKTELRAQFAARGPGG